MLNHHLKSSILSPALKSRVVLFDPANITSYNPAMGDVPKELKIIGNHVALRVGIIILAIGIIIMSALYFSNRDQSIPLSALSLSMKDFCQLHDIKPEDCKLKKGRIVLPKGSR